MNRPSPAPRLQPLTRARVASLGERGASWLAALPSVIAELESDWSISVEHELPGGSGSYVARARTADGEPVVIKIAVQPDGLAPQAATLRRASGEGYVRLLAVDLDRQAVLLESLGPSLEQSTLSPAGYSSVTTPGTWRSTIAASWLDTQLKARRP